MKADVITFVNDAREHTPLITSTLYATLYLILRTHKTSLQNQYHAQHFTDTLMIIVHSVLNTELTHSGFFKVSLSPVRYCVG